MTYLKWIAGGGCIAVVALYLLACVIAYAIQDSLLFHPGNTSRASLDAAAEPLGVEPFTIVASDGVRLYGWHRKGDADRVLLYLHGNGGSISAVPWLADQLPGVDVFCVSYRGFPGSEGVPSEAGMVLDAQALWAYIVDDLGFNPQRIVVQGQSMGGGVAHHLLTTATPAGVVFDSTFVSLQAIASDTVPFLPVRWLLKHPFRSDLRAPHIQVPALVLHGDADTLIPVRHGRQLASLLPHATYVELSNHGHGDWTLDRPEAMSAWRAFLATAWREGQH
jgi:uncharacterized protein